MRRRSGRRQKCERGRAPLGAGQGQTEKDEGPDLAPRPLLWFIAVARILLGVEGARHYDEYVPVRLRHARLILCNASHAGLEEGVAVTEVQWRVDALVVEHLLG